MNILVTYYSRAGHTRKLAEKIAAQLNADLDEIVDLKNRSGIWGWIVAAKDALLKKRTAININKSPMDYDLVIVGTPVWANTMCPAVRNYLTKHSFNQLAFFCTFGGAASHAFDDMAKLSGKKPLATLGLKDKEIDESQEAIQTFCSNLNG